MFDSASFHKEREIDHLSVHSDRVAAALSGRPYESLSYTDRESRKTLGASSLSEVNSKDAELRSVYDRVRNRTKMTSRRMLGTVDENQVAAAISYTAKRYMDGASKIYTPDNIKDAYGRATSTVISYLEKNGDLNDILNDNSKSQSQSSDGGDSQESDKKKAGGAINLYFGDEDAQERKENPDDDEKDDGKSVTGFMIDLDDLERHVRSDTELFDEMSKLIDQTPAIALRIDSKTEPDNEGEERDTAPLTIDGIMRMTMSGMAYFAVDSDLFASRISDQRMYTNVRIEEPKTLEVICIDASSSMGGGQRYIRAYAYLHNRIEQAKNGKAIIAAIMFTGSPKLLSIGGGSESFDIDGDDETPITYNEIEGTPAWVIDTPQKAIEAERRFFLEYSIHLGGGTDIPRAIDMGYSVIDQIRTIIGDKIMGDTTYLTVITDDDPSSVGIKIKPKIAINCLAVADNPAMRTVCAESGGTFNLLNIISIPT